MAKKKGRGGGARRPGGHGAPQQKPKKQQAPGTAAGGAPAAAPAGPRKPTQAERIEAARRERQRRSRRIRIGVAVLVVVLVGGALGIFLNNRRAAGERVQTLEASGACEFDRRSDRLQPAPNNHVAPPGYNVNPPAGGDHSPQPSPPGDFSSGERPADPNVVHSLEHGYIALWYTQDVPERDLEALRGVFRAYPRDVLLLPREGMPVPVAATAWNRRILCSRVDAPTLRRFIEYYRNQGPEKVPH